VRARLWRAGLTLALLLVLVFGVGAPPERCPSVSPAELRRSAQAAVDWFVRNQEPDGDWLYEYNADDDSIPTEYNEVRHAGVTMGLYQAAAAGLPGALRSADRGTEWALDRLVEREGWAAFTYNGRTTTGATALLVAGLVIRREATGDARYDEELRRLGRFLLAQAEPSGAVLAEYDPAQGAPVPGEYSKYYTGEAYWALALLHRAFPDEGWDETADRRLPRHLA
jgi:mannose/cellobiose epimerase-like protein (N-acyl-D-glucosamine 2-epimerase family)